MPKIPLYKDNFHDATYEQAYTHKTGNFDSIITHCSNRAHVKLGYPNWNAIDVKVAISNRANILDAKYDVFYRVLDALVLKL